MNRTWNENIKLIYKSLSNVSNQICIKPFHFSIIFYDYLEIRNNDEYLIAKL